MGLTLSIDLLEVELLDVVVVLNTRSTGPAWTD